MEFERDNNVINVFIFVNVNIGGGGIGIILGYYFFFKDWLVICKNDVGIFEIIMIYEFGYFFSLFYFFNGWDFEFWDVAMYGIIVNQIIVLDNFMLVELVDGSNCGSVGDFICDILFNYNFGFGWVNCNFIIEVKDCNGDVFDLEECLFMSYFLNCLWEEYFFFDDQILFMQVDFVFFQWFYIRSNYILVLEEINEMLVFIGLINSEIVEGFNVVNLFWDFVFGVQVYVLQILCLFIFFVMFMVYDEVVYGIFKVINSFLENINYFWRVCFFSVYWICIEFLDVEVFIIGSIVVVDDIELFDVFNVVLNFVSGQANVLINLKVNQVFFVFLFVYNMVGQEIVQLGEVKV